MGRKIGVYVLDRAAGVPFPSRLLVSGESEWASLHETATSLVHIGAHFRWPCRSPSD